MFGVGVTTKRMRVNQDMLKLSTIAKSSLEKDDNGTAFISEFRSYFMQEVYYGAEFLCYYRGQ